MQTPMMVCVTVVALAMAAVGPGHAQPAASAAQSQALKRTVLQTFDVPNSDYQTVIGLSELGPNKSSGRQNHPGAEGGYVLQGSGTIILDGQPPLRLKAGQSYQLAPGAAHDVRTGPKGVKLIVVWDVKKGEPLSSPAH